MKGFLLRWIICTIAVLAASSILPGIHHEGLTDLVIAALLLGILNTFVKPILFWLSLPFLIMTLGLFLVVINALLLMFVDFLVKGFTVDSFWSAFFGSIVISVITLVLNVFTGNTDSKAQVKRSHTAPPSPPRREDTGSGPIIDV